MGCVYVCVSGGHEYIDNAAGSRSAMQVGPLEVSDS